MTELPRLCSAEPVIHGVLKLVFADGFEGVVDLRPLLSQGKIFTWLQRPENFRSLQVDEFGHSISWTNEEGYEIDLGADSLKRDCVRQAEIHKLMVG